MREKQLYITGYTEQRVQVKSECFRIPDITIVAGEGPETGVIKEPPFLCIEILSPEDRVKQTRERVGDYLDFGVRYVWIIDPETRLATVYSPDGIAEVKDGILNTKNPDITINLSELQ